MAKKLSRDDQAVLKSLVERMLTTIQFIQNVQSFPSGTELRSIIEQAASADDLRTIRLINREIDAMTLALALNEREGLEALLLQRVGVDKDAERGEWRRSVVTAIKRGTVASEKERRHLEDYAEMLEATGGDPAEIAAVNHLLQGR